jgi:hypothetical protein
MRTGGKKDLILPLILAMGILLIASGAAYAVPNPVIALSGTVNGTGSDGNPYVYYHFKVTNYTSYPDSMFVERPDLAPCGENTSASQTWLDIYDANTNTRIYGFCGFGQASDLLLLPWFALTPGVAPPPIYIKLVDRDPSTGGTYTSNTITVYSPTAPVAAADSQSTPESTAVSFNVLSNDTDINADTLSVTGFSVSPSHGSVSNLGAGSVRYTPTAHYNGSDTFTYQVSDGTFTSTATVSLTVTAVEDPPVAAGDTATVNEDSSVSVNVLANDSDYDTPYGDVLSLQSVSAALHGTAAIVGSQISYTPNPNYNGSDTFTYTMRDSAALTSTASVSVTVNSVADVPNTPSTTLTDSRTNPINVSEYTPLFSWVFTDVDTADASGDWQSAFEIRIGTASGLSNVWDSTKVSSLTSGAPYGGVVLTPNVTYHWSVRVWDRYDLASSYSVDATFVILDIGLRVYDGTQTVKVATDYAGLSYKLRIRKGGTTYGIILVDPADSSASKIRVRTSTGVMALKKM